MVKKKQRKKKSKVILKFEPNLNFKEEFADFVEEVLKWKKAKKRNLRDLQKNKGRK